MGICSSCLGFAQRSSDAERSDSSHLLGDPYQPHYGSINQPSAHSLPQPDPEEIRRQRDALERICAQTSDKLIHVSQAAYTDDSGQSEYLRLFNERFPPLNSASRPASAHATHDEDEAAWLASLVGNSNDAEGSWERVEPIESGALTVQFGEALGDKKR